MIKGLIPTLLLALAGCAGAAPPALDGQGASALSGFLRETVEKGAVPGVVVLVTSKDQVLYHEGFGTMDAARGVAMHKDAIFRIASMTKALTSTGVMMLVEQGKLGLDDDVARYLPALRNPRVISRIDFAAHSFETRPAARPITIRQLLTHTSGIGYPWSDPGLAMIEKLTGSNSEVDLPLVNEPGAQWTYGASTKVLGDVIERISGQTIEAYLETRIFGPLEMFDTGYRVPEARHERVVTLHVRKDGRLTESPNPAQLSAQPRGDGRLFSTAADYSHFVQMMLNRGQWGAARLLKPETVELMSRDHTGAVKVRLQPVANAEYSRPYPRGAGEDAWALGFQRAAPAKPLASARRPGSLSWAGINNTFFWIDPQAGVGVVVLMQLLPFYDEAALGVLDGVETRVYQHLCP